ncbi:MULTISPECIES: hypothetical protein [unclassified Mesobacillus]|uniref:hypothetical protein n=1 Tax=unclassified Mesobacillus TaxID=2675270 RepID=UPI00203CA3BE|nr:MULTISPECIES: hypothetical protein [unclassified Mesobacillus]MCM3124344.1 hypothetical protein [Mesobacillus sp. MER 33]MCM3234946.1 hypothetical protein [Mesobacillus sp. MER 48]
MNKGSTGMALFGGTLVGVVVFLVEYLIPNTNLITKAIIAALSALLGGWIGSRLFPK